MTAPVLYPEKGGNNMLEELKQVGILLGREELAPIEGSNCKTGFLRRMSRE